jgi:hypothetical protein
MAAGKGSRRPIDPTEDFDQAGGAAAGGIGRSGVVAVTAGERNRSRGSIVVRQRGHWSPRMYVAVAGTVSLHSGHCM